jgi:hypothetical protein
VVVVRGEENKMYEVDGFDASLFINPELQWAVNILA